MRQGRQKQCSPGMGCCDSAAISPLFSTGHSCTHKQDAHTLTHSINAQTQQASLFAGNSTLRCRDHVPERPCHCQRVSLSIFNVCPGTEARATHIHPIFVHRSRGVPPWISPSLCGFWLQGYWHNGQRREQWCQMLWERNTQSDIGTARRICLRCWSQRPAWHTHAWYNS